LKNVFEIFDISTNNIISVEAAKVLTIWCDSFVKEGPFFLSKKLNWQNYKPYHFSFVNLGLSKLVFIVVPNITQFWTKVIMLLGTHYCKWTNEEVLPQKHIHK
jgi:hypothetical protein